MKNYLDLLASGSLSAAFVTMVLGGDQANWRLPASPERELASGSVILIIYLMICSLYLFWRSFSRED